MLRSHHNSTAIDNCLSSLDSRNALLIPVIITAYDIFFEHNNYIHTIQPLQLLASILHKVPPQRPVVSFSDNVRQADL